jgi:hypothetical protein
MPRRPLPAEILWERHKQLYLKVFSIALRELVKKDNISGNEDAISETLSLILREVCLNVCRDQNQEVPPPIWEAPIPPKSEGELKGGKSRKRPDFTCRLLNPLAESVEEYEVSLHVECKRVGRSTSPSWNLNKNYVKNGIKRFDCHIHEYGKRAPSGMMIGYIISMTPKKIEAEVNAYQKQYLSNCSELKFKFDMSLLFLTCQQIQRKSIEPAQFELIHLWVDLRGEYQT